MFQGEDKDTSITHMPLDGELVVSLCCIFAYSFFMPVIGQTYMLTFYTLSHKAERKKNIWVSTNRTDPIFGQSEIFLMFE